MSVCAPNCHTVLAVHASKSNHHVSWHSPSQGRPTDDHAVPCVHFSSFLNDLLDQGCRNKARTVWEH